MKRWALRGLALLAALVAARLALPKPDLWEGADFSRAVFDRDGHLLRLTLTSDEKYRLRTRLKEISPALVEATLFQEDRAFRRHPGVNPLRLAKAAWDTYVRRDRREGGSTLTMQLARMRFGIDSRTVVGKAQQALRALQVECFYSKDQILEAYLNRVPYGGNVEGVGAASLIYFHKKAERLTVPEAATLTVIPQNPTGRSPLRAGALAHARTRLLAAWRPGAEEGSLAVYRPEELPFVAPHFAQEVLDADPSDGDVATTLDSKLQRLAERQLRRYIERRREVGVKNAAVLLVDWRTLEEVASVGSANFFDSGIQGQVNGTRAKRSPGSALKPFIYALGFDQGLIHPRTMLKDAPSSFSGYDPENFDGAFVGPIPAGEALAKSRNVPAVQVASKLHDPSFYEFLKRAEISQLRPEEDYGLSLVLGSAEVTMEEVAGLYAMLANGGVKRPLRARLDAPAVVGTRLLSDEASFMALDALRTGHQRPGQAFIGEWTRDALPISWKTGTSHGYRDAWTAGVFGPYVLVVWVGNFDGQSNPAFVGLDSAAPLFFELIDAIRSERPEIARVAVRPPAGVTRVKVCAISGDLPGPHCQHTVSTWFIPGRSPIKICDVHREVWVDSQTGQRTCDPGPFARAEVYEFWPSDLLKLFRQAGMPRRLPPGGGDACSLDARASHGNPPQITSPENGIDYAVRMSTLGTQTLPLAAVTDADVHALYWFLDEHLVGTSGVREPLFWKAQPGSYVVRVVDDQGRSDARELKVTLVK